MSVINSKIAPSEPRNGSSGFTTRSRKNSFLLTQVLTKPRPISPTALKNLRQIRAHHVAAAGARRRDRLRRAHELNKVELLRDVFIWAYERSAARLRRGEAVTGRARPLPAAAPGGATEVIGAVVRGPMDKKQAGAYVRSWTQGHVEQNERERSVRPPRPSS